MNSKDKALSPGSSTNSVLPIQSNDVTPKEASNEQPTNNVEDRVDKVEIASPPPDKKEKFPCPLCPKEFQHKSGRFNHIKIHHKVKLDFGKVHCLENGCLFSCTYTTVLQQHLTNVHNIPMKYLNLEFDSYEEFEKWKHDFETGEVCRFVKKSGSRVCVTGKSMYLYCSRSGTFVSHGQGRRCKKLGTAKISAHCTALIKYFEESSGRVKATVCSTHYGHDKDHRFLRLTKNQKQHIADKIKSGMSRDLLLDSLHSTFVDKLDRIHELSKKDLKNIQVSYKIPRVEGRSKSQSSEEIRAPTELFKDSWIVDIDMVTDSPVLFYKDLACEHDRLESKDKCLILMTKGQKDLFLKFCNNSVLYVTILRISSAIPLFLSVIFILDDFYETFPVCFMISTNTKLEMLQTLFDTILTTIGPVPVRALATDDNAIIIQAWCDVMGPNSNFIIANRFVDAEWRKHLTVVEDEACQGEIYDKLYEFIEGAEGGEENMVSLIKELRSSVVASPFATYLEKNFLLNIQQWSTCYLKENYDLREPIDFELSYSKISSLCEVCCKYSKRVDYCAKGLIKLLLEFQFNRNRKVAESISEINNAHDQSLSCGMENVFPFKNGVWKVNSQSVDQGMFEVKVTQCNFDDCLLKCARCEACVHNFYCVCDNYIDGKTCIHVHLVGCMLKKVQNDASVNDEDLWSFEMLADNLRSERESDEALQEHSPQLRSKKLESLKVLENIGKILMSENDEKRLDNLSTLIKDVRGNVNMLLNYGDHAKKMIFTKNSKPARKKPKKIKKQITRRKITKN